MVECSDVRTDEQQCFSYNSNAVWLNVQTFGQTNNNVSVKTLTLTPYG